MKKKFLAPSRAKVILSLFWVVFTFSFVLWWWLFSLYQTKIDNIAHATEQLDRIHRMFFWEGLVLLPVLFLGGVALVYFSYRDFQRGQQHSLFFSNFTHDMKTSITRLRLQMDLMADTPSQKNPAALSALMQEMARLDLQLENSLFMARTDDPKFFAEKVLLSDLVSSIKSEWPELEVSLDRNATLQVDREAMKSVLRNLFQNSLRHGQATQIQFKVSALNEDLLKVDVADNGRGLSRAIPRLGKEMVHSQSSGNGIGLYLSAKLMNRMKGQLDVPSQPSGQGYAVSITIPGSLR